ncbi:MAG: hypothetical protein WCE98_04330, partial [Chlorobium sp.]
HVQRLGLTIAGVTAALHIAFLWIRDIVLSRQRVSMVLRSIAVTLVFVMVVSGLAALLAVTGLFGDLWVTFDRLHDWFLHLGLRAQTG